MTDIKKRMAIVRERGVSDPEDWHDAFGAMMRAEEYFAKNLAQFDPGGPRHFNLCLLMARVLFGSGKGKGLKFWTKSRLRGLARAHRDLKRLKPSASDARIAEALCKHPYFKSDPEGLRQRLPEAKSLLEEWEEMFGSRTPEEWNEIYRQLKAGTAER
jgi:hypothetical protein